MTLCTKNKLVDLFVTLEELYQGTTKTISFKKCLPCDYCFSIDRELETTYAPCTKCCGQGVNLDVAALKPSTAPSLILCSECEGSGEKNTLPCGSCQDLGVVFVTQEIVVKIPRGTYPGELITFLEEANQQYKMTPGDVVVTILVKPHPYFAPSLNSPDLFYKHYVDDPLVSAPHIPTLCGHTIPVSDAKESLGNYGLWCKDGVSRGTLTTKTY